MLTQTESKQNFWQPRLQANSNTHKMNQMAFSEASYASGRPIRASIDSSILSDPPSDLDDHENPFTSSPAQTRAPRTQAPIYQAPAPMHRNGIGESIANKRVKYQDELLGSPQAIWERRFKNTPLAPTQNQRQRDKIFFRQIVNDCKNDAREERNEFTAKLGMKDEKIGELINTIDGLEWRLKELEERREELLRENKSLTEARDVAREGNVDRNKQIEGLRKTLRGKSASVSNYTGCEGED